MNREEKKRATRQKILNSALALFAEHGYEATTVHLITERAGVAKGTFFNYFASKEEVLCDVQMLIASEEISKLKGKQGPLIPQVREVLTLMHRHIPVVSRSLILTMVTCTITNKKVLEHEMASIAELKRELDPLIEQAQERGEVTRSMPAAMISEMAIQNYYGACLCWGMGIGDDNFTTHMIFSFELFFRGIAAS